MSEALRLADLLDNEQSMKYAAWDADSKTHPAAAELRRLHARSEEQERLLRDALEAFSLLMSDIYQGADPADAECRKRTGSYDKAGSSITAIRKHLGEQT